MTVTTMQPRSLTDAVREVGQYGSAAEAESVTHTVLVALAAHVPLGERDTVTAVLPSEVAKAVPVQPLVARSLTAREFVDSIATHMDIPPARARWHVTSVLMALSHHSVAATTRLIKCLPAGYALLFGRAELATAA